MLKSVGAQDDYPSVAQRKLAMPEWQPRETTLSARGRRRKNLGEFLVIAAGFALAMLGAVEVMQQQSGTSAATAQTPAAMSRSQR
jgi:hypothetical protein